MSESDRYPAAFVDVATDSLALLGLEAESTSEYNFKVKSGLHHVHMAWAGHLLTSDVLF